MPDILFRVLIYRMFNEPRTYEYLRKLIVNGYNGRKAAEILDRKRDAGITVFRGAWMTSGANVVGSKAKAYCLEMDRVYKHREDIWERVKDAGSMEAAWRVICELKWFGGFSAYQVVLDLSYITGIRSLWPDYDMWVYPGPGAKMGLMWLMGKNPIRRKGAGERPSEKVCSRLIYHLRDKQDDYFKKFKYKFRRWEDKPLDLHNIEYSLCEANKYFRAHYGGKKKKFIPHDEQGKLF
jgi:hypothetical protein